MTDEKPMTLAKLLHWHVAQAKVTGADRDFHLEAAAFLRHMAKAKSDHRKNIAAGLAKARKSGTKSGRPLGRPRVSAKTEAEIKRLLQQGYGTNAIRNALSVGVAKIIAIKRELGIEVGARPGYSEEAD